MGPAKYWNQWTKSSTTAVTASRPEIKAAVAATTAKSVTISIILFFIGAIPYPHTQPAEILSDELGGLFVNRCGVAKLARESAKARRPHRLL
jgi:hypothetical protein